MNHDHFFYLFGCRIVVPHDLEAHDPSPYSGALVPVHTTLTLSTNTTTDDNNQVLSPEPLRSYNPYANYDSSSSTAGSKPKRKYQKRQRPDGDNNPERARNVVRRRSREPLQPHNDLSDEVLRLISPARPVFLYRKQLQLTDVEKHQNRLLVTDTDRLKEFLTEEETAKSKVDVSAVDARGRTYEMKLSKWGEKDQKKKGSVVLNTEWNRMVKANDVKVYDYVDLWGFRPESTGEFCLAIAFSRA